MSLATPDRARLVARARRELPHPGDPRQLIDELLDAGLAGEEALQVLGRTSLAWTQLRDLALERSWQNGFGWFQARNLIVFGVLALVLFLALRPPAAVLDGALVGAALSYLVNMAIAPLRLRRHGRRRAGILARYAEDLGAYLDSLEG